MEIGWKLCIVNVNLPRKGGDLTTATEPVSAQNLTSFKLLNQTQDLSFLSGPDVDLDDIARTLAVSVIVNGQNLTWDFTQIGTILATIVILGE